MQAKQHSQRLTPCEMLAIEATVCLSEAHIYLGLLRELPELICQDEIASARAEVANALRLTLALAPSHTFAD